MVIMLDTAHSQPAEQLGIEIRYLLTHLETSHTCFSIRTTTLSGFGQAAQNHLTQNKEDSLPVKAKARTFQLFEGYEALRTQYL